eukprot:3605882-Amphidinium_carterae.2
MKTIQTSTSGSTCKPRIAYLLFAVREVSVLNGGTSGTSKLTDGWKKFKGVKIILDILLKLQLCFAPKEARLGIWPRSVAIDNHHGSNNHSSNINQMVHGSRSSITSTSSTTNSSSSTTSTSRDESTEMAL